MFSWSDFHFLRPFWLLLVPLAVIMLFISARSRKQTAWDRVIDPHLLPYLLHDRERRPRSTFKSAWLSLFFMLIAVALAGPTLKKIPSDVGFQQAPLIICLEISEHMLSKDINPSRLKRAIFKLEDLLNSYKGAEVALIAFAGDAHLVVPLSNDYNTVLTMAKTLTPDLMPIKGVKLGSAIELANQISAKNPRAQVVVMTSSNFDDQAIDRIKPLNTPLVVWAFASDAGGPLELADGRFDQDRKGGVTISKLRREILTKLAELDRVSTLIYSPDSSDIRRIVEGLSDSAPVRSERELFFDQWYDLGPYVVALAMLVFLGGIFFVKESILLVSFLLFLPSPSIKADVADWFLRKDQQAQKALENGQPEKAAELFDDDFRKGTAFYRAKNYDEAIKHLSRVNTSDGHYNLGNALAQKSRFEEAIAAYDQALKLDQKNRDAQTNKELLEKLQKEKEKKQNQSDQKGENAPKDQESSPSENESEKEGQNKKSGESKDSGTKDKENEEPANKSQQAQEKAEQKEHRNQAEGAKEGDKKPAEKKDLKAQADTKGEKLDPESRYYFQRLEQNNSFFLKRKFLYESQKRQEEGK